MVSGESGEKPSVGEGEGGAGDCIEALEGFNEAASVDSVLLSCWRAEL